MRLPGGGGAGNQPWCGGCTHPDERHKVLAEAGLWQLRADFAEGLDGLVADHRLLHGAEAFEERQQEMAERWAAHKRHESAELLRLRQQHLVVIVRVLGQEGDELAARSLLAERQRDGRQARDAVQPAERLLALQLLSAGVGRAREGRTHALR